MSQAVLSALEWQAQACAHLGAPSYAALLKHAKEDASRGGITARLFAPWAQASAEKARNDAIALRLLASLHYLVLSGRAPELAASYPPQGSDMEVAWTACRTALASNEPLVAGLLEHEPQTNEVRRSACLLGGFLQIAQETGLPLRCFEVGASAGLNSLWDKFCYQIGGRTWGEVDSPVVLNSRWEGAARPLDVSIHVAERRACDRRPIDVRRPDDATRLLSYVWPEQADRLSRLRAAIELALASDLRVEAGGASTWVRCAIPIPGAATVVFHSIVMQYMPSAERSAFNLALESLGARATRDAPFAWLRLEPNLTGRGFQLSLTTWPSGEDRLLAEGHPHGEFAVWQ